VNFFAPSGTKPLLVQNQYGGSLGGPVIKNRAWLFGAYEGNSHSQRANERINRPIPGSTRWNIRIDRHLQPVLHSPQFRHSYVQRFGFGYAWRSSKLLHQRSASQDLGRVGFVRQCFENDRRTPSEIRRRCHAPPAQHLCREQRARQFRLYRCLHAESAEPRRYGQLDRRPVARHCQQPHFRPRLLSGPKIQASMQEYFDNSCFVSPNAYVFGNSGRNILRAPGINILISACIANFACRSNILPRSSFAPKLTKC
jgi:hypothetical protein